MIPVHVVTGFLGSGKTTLLRAVLADPSFADTAVIVNEFGEVGLDHALLEEVEEGVLLLASGCVCCTIRSDLQETLRDLQDRASRGDIPQFRRVVIETTGLADPGPIVSTLTADPVLRSQFALGRVVCTLDGQLGAQTLQAQPEAAAQLAAADQIIVTKRDLVTARAAASLAVQASAINPLALLSEAAGGAIDAARLLEADPARQTADRASAVAAASVSEPARIDAHAHGSTRSVVLRFAAPIDWVAFGVWLTALLHAHGSQILRVKGLLAVSESDAPLVIHGVQHVIHPPEHLARWPDADRSSRIVFILRDMPDAPLRASLQAFLSASAAGD